MATEEKDPQNTEETAAAPAKKKLPMGLIAILGQCVLTLGAAGFAIWAINNPPKPPVSVSELKERTIASIEDKEEDIKHIELEEFQVNSKSGGTLRTKLTLEVSNPEVETTIKNRLPRVKDRVAAILSEVEKKDIQDIQGKLAVKNHIRNSINDLILPMMGDSATGLVREVYVIEIMTN